MDTPRPHRDKTAGAKSAERFDGFVSVQSRGAVMLPPAVRTRLGLDTPGAQLELTEREDGVLEVRPMIAVPADQAWFWTPTWQAGEAEVDEHVRVGQVTVSPTAQDFLHDLKDLDDDDHQERLDQERWEHDQAQGHAGGSTNAPPASTPTTRTSAPITGACSARPSPSSPRLATPTSPPAGSTPGPGSCAFRP